MIMFLTARRSREARATTTVGALRRTSSAFDFWQLYWAAVSVVFLAAVVQTEGYWPTGVSRARLLSRAANPPRVKNFGS